MKMLEYRTVMTCKLCKNKYIYGANGLCSVCVNAKSDVMKLRRMRW